MSENAQPKRQPSPVEIQAQIWRAMDREAIAHRGNSIIQQAELDARRQLRKVIDDCKAGQP